LFRALLLLLSCGLLFNGRSERMINPAAHRIQGMSVVNASLSAEFLAECGGAGPIELAVQNGESAEARRCAFHQPFVLIGRKNDTDLVLPDGQVSRRHAYLQMLSGWLYCFDLQSRTGIHWEDGNVQSGWFDQNRAFRIGPFRMQLSQAAGG